MGSWKVVLVATPRGTFEVFCKGEGPPLCVSHLYSVFNSTGDYFADCFTGLYQVFLVNLREAGASESAHEPYQLSMLESVLDLEAIREELEFPTWTFAGHSTGGMLGLVYGMAAAHSLNQLVITNAAARMYMDSPKCIYHNHHPQFSYMQQLIEQLKSPLLTSGEKRRLQAERTKLSLVYDRKYESYFSKNIHKEMSRPRMDFFARELHIFDVTQQLYKINVPVWIAAGKYDVQCPVEFSIEMHQYLNHSRLTVFEESNHYPFLKEKERFEHELDELGGIQ
ncbi:proline iminopeptidase [Halobacillus alkaliphilus]|uniref:Proline iminopeptidase n=1 Tax=Halobacillus alkaliphilus TaxID=396056 RepID=A0A1I2RN88_9BACI|nr:alpha/beta hydrolase [Halobacillus alkaliphilus]SFG40087.1 proline iminopeptidase [Halobacillus alkaliphilus]